MLFALLGPLVVLDDAGAQVAVPGARRRVLLATLLLRANTPVPAEVLAEAVWDGSPPDGYAATLRSHIRWLRRALGPSGAARIAARDPGYVIRLEEADLDVLRFEALSRDTDEAGRRGDWDAASRTAAQALELWRAEPLLDVPSQTLRDQAVPRLDQIRVHLLEQHVQAGLHLGRHGALIPQLRELTARYPLRERFHAQLMTSLARVGRQAEALAAYQHARRLLVGELGIEPGPELRALHERLLAGGSEPVVGEAGEADPAAAAAVPRQLPAAARHFVGRRDELDALTALLEQTSATGGTVVISAIDGMAGIGKTALAVHVAHRLAEKFPDGQLFIDLHGYTQGHEPRPAGEALDWFLRSLDVPAQRIPPDTEERAALYRQHVADSRTLIVLDNASDEAQVRPLLPGSAGCLVLVTSRRRLVGLDDTLALSLDVLPETDAIALVRNVAGPGRAPADDRVLAEIAELCGRLPLALRIAAALLRHRPAWSAEYLAGLLRDRPIGALSDGEHDLGAVFDLSYQSLTHAQKHLFRRLGLVPGPDFDAHATAALTGTDPATAARLLEGLVDHNLLIEHAPGRYRLHDLLRLHAHTLVGRDPAGDRDAALARLLDYYRHTAGRADALITRYPHPVPAGPAPAHAPGLSEPEAAWAWLRTERPNLLAAVHHAAGRALHEQTAALSAGLATMLRTDGPWPEAVSLYAAARHLGDPAGRAHTLLYLGDVRALVGDCASAMGDLREALGLYREQGDRLGQANALTRLGNVRAMISDVPDATRDMREALELYRELGERCGLAHALNLLAGLKGNTGDYPGAERDLREALGLYRELGHRHGQADALTELGRVGTLVGEYPGATRHLREALELHRGLGDRRGQAHVLSYLSHARQVLGDHPGAVRDQREALELYQQLGDRRGQAIALGYLGQLWLLTGDCASAMRDLRTALDLSRSVGARGNEAWALNLYAAAVAAAGDRPEALRLYHDALRLNGRLNQPDEEAIALEGLGECHLADRDTAAAATHLRRALEIFQRLGMAPDARRVQDRLDGLAGRE